MIFSDFISNLRRRDANAAVIFDQEEPVGRATDLVMPRRHFFRRRRETGKAAASRSPLTSPNDR
ncbi:MAG: hypothetical protein H0X34_08505 [Chthoniobacterales bacterium]|nr:hypothetical protein [Chthoniobacterales bacterium]